MSVNKDKFQDAEETLATVAKLINEVSDRAVSPDDVVALSTLINAYATLFELTNF